MVTNGTVDVTVSRLIFHSQFLFEVFFAGKDNVTLAYNKIYERAFEKGTNKPI